jgi:hypothetical protein
MLYRWSAQLPNIIIIHVFLGTNSTCPALPSSDYRNSKLEKMIKDQKDREELNLKFGFLTWQDMEIVAHHILTNSQVCEMIFIVIVI